MTTSEREPPQSDEDPHGSEGAARPDAIAPGRPHRSVADAWSTGTRQSVLSQVLRTGELDPDVIIQQVLQTISEGFWIVDTSRRLLDVNQAYCTMSGYSREELLQLTISDLEANESEQETVRHIELLMQQGSGRFESRHRHKDGRLFDVEVSVTVLDHRRGLMIGFCRDITKRKQAELALRASEERYRGLIESLDSGVAIFDDEGRIIYLNDVAARTMDGVPHDFVGRSMYECFARPIADAQLHSIRTAIREDRRLTIEFQGMLQGQPRWHRATVQPIHDEQDRAIYALVNATDIHNLKTVQDKLLELNRTLEERVRERTKEVQDLYDLAPIGYHSLDPDGNLLIINQTELNWLGYTREELLGRSFTDILTQASRAVFHEQFPAFKQRGWARDIEFEMLRKDGSSFPVMISATANYDPTGAYLLSRSTVVDITERKAAESAMREANAELARAARAKDEFLANMSHELRTPLNAILAFSESLLEEIQGPLSPAQQKALNHIDASGRHLLTLINDILDLAKVEAGRLDVQFEAFLVADICQSSLVFVKELAVKKSLSLTYTVDNRLSEIVADPRRLKQMLVNLLSNAVKFTPEGGEVELSAAVDDSTGHIHFAVKDTGIGIAPGDLARLFHPFSQLDTRLTRQHEGTGLGLTLVRRLAELHGGTISVESEVGLGSCFTIALPYSPSPPGEDTEAP